MGLAESEVPHGGGVGLLPKVVDLVGCQHDGLLAAAQHVDNGMIDVLGADGGVHDEQDDVGGGDGQLGLLCDLCSHTFGVRGPASGVDDHEFPASPVGVVADPVPGDAGQVLHHSLAAADDAVHQHRLPDVGPADDGHDGFDHIDLGGLCHGGPFFFARDQSGYRTGVVGRPSAAVPDCCHEAFGGMVADSSRTHWLNSERVRVYPRLIVAMIGVAIIANSLSLHDGVDISGHPVGSDFVTFYAASTLALAGDGVQAWDIAALAKVQLVLFPAYALGPFAWFYPPTFLLLVTPFAFLPYLAAFAAFVASTAAVWYAALRKAIGRPGAGWLVAAFPGLWVCVAHGQNGLLTAALAGGSLLLLRRRPVLSGVLLGLLMIKPQLAVVFAVALVATRAWRTMLVAAGTALAFLGVSVAAFGARSLPAWFDSLQLARLATEDGYLPWHKMPSTFAMLRLLGASVEWSYLVHGLVSLVAVAAVLLVWRRADSLRLRGAVLMAATFLVNPYAFDYDLAWLAFPIAWLACHGLERGWRRGDREVLTAAWVLPMVATSVALLTHVQLAPLVLGALVWIAVRRVLDVRPPEVFVRVSQRWGGLSQRFRPGRQQRG